MSLEDDWWFTWTIHKHVGFSRLFQEGGFKFQDPILVRHNVTTLWMPANTHVTTTDRQEYWINNLCRSKWNTSLLYLRVVCLCMYTVVLCENFGKTAFRLLLVSVVVFRTRTKLHTIDVILVRTPTHTQECCIMFLLEVVPIAHSRINLGSLQVRRRKRMAPLIKRRIIFYFYTGVRSTRVHRNGVLSTEYSYLWTIYREPPWVDLTVEERAPLNQFLVHWVCHTS
jgi:hypothetical protein